MAKAKQKAKTTKPKAITLELSEYHQRKVTEISSGLGIDPASAIKVLIEEAIEGRSDIKRAKSKRWDFR